MTNRLSLRQKRRNPWYGILAVLLGAFTSAVSAFGLPTSFTGEASVVERGIDARTHGKPATVRHDPLDPALNLWGGDDRAASAPGQWDDPSPRIALARASPHKRFNLPIRFELIRDGASRARPAA